MNRWVGNIPEFLEYYEEARDGALIIPRGFCRQMIILCRRHGISYKITDQRRLFFEVAFTFKGKLKPFQEEAVSALLKRDFGTLSAPTASGKTVMALSIIADRKQPALIVVHTKELLSQWIDRIEFFLGIPANEVGIIGGGKKKIGEKITVALVQSLYKCAEEVSPHIGHLIVDECHRAPSRTFSEAVTAFDSKFILGLSATPWRRDKLSRLIFFHLGDVVHEVPKDDLVGSGDILRAEVVTRQTNFTTHLDPSEEYSRMLSELTKDPARNKLICADIAAELKSRANGTLLILSDRRVHCEALREKLAREYQIPSELLVGSMTKTQREAVIDRLCRGRVKVLVATTQLIGEGFDCPGLSTLFLTTPIKFEGRLLQCLGRVLRPAPGKRKARVYDYFDQHVGVLRASAKLRRQVYNAN